MSEEIGKHKGAVETLLHEKKELSRLLQIVNSQLQKHLGALDEAGVDTDQFIEDIQQGASQQQKKQRQKKQQKKSRQRNQSRDSSSSSRSENSKQEDEDDADDLLEGEDDFSDRDFSPR